MGNLSWVYCPVGYPVRPSDVRLPDFGDTFIGLSSHCPDIVIAPIAVARGAKYLEFHLTLDDGVPTLDDCVNLTATRFREMVRLVRRAEMML